MHASTALIDFPNLCETYPVGAAISVEGSPEYDRVYGVDRGGWIVVRASAYDRPGCYPITVSVNPDRVRLLNMDEHGNAVAVEGCTRCD